MIGKGNYLYIKQIQEKASQSQKPKDNHNAKKIGNQVEFEQTNGWESQHQMVGTTS